MIGLAHDGEEDISKDTSSRFSSGPRNMNKGFPMTSIYTFLCRKGDERRMEKKTSVYKQGKIQRKRIFPLRSPRGRRRRRVAAIAVHSSRTQPGHTPKEGCLPSHFSDLYFLSLFPFSLIISFSSSLLSLSFS